jgi:hypothetical protein
MAHADDVVLPDEDRGLAVPDLITDEVRRAGNDEQLVAIDLDLRQLVRL